MAKLIQVSAEVAGRTFVGVDDEGGVWRGEIKTDRRGEEYITWKLIRSEFERRG